MKNLILITFCLFTFIFSYSQCTPDPSFADSSFGVWPTPQTNFPDGDIGVFYDEVVYFKVPRDAGNIDSAYAGQLIDSIILSSVTNLPPGLSYQCDIPSCTWNFDSVGCASISGTPTTNGSYQISLDATVWTEIFLTPFPVPYSFNGYSINIGPTSRPLAHIFKIFLTPLAASVFVKTKAFAAPSKRLFGIMRDLSSGSSAASECISPS